MTSKIKDRTKFDFSQLKWIIDTAGGGVAQFAPKVGMTEKRLQDCLDNISEFDMWEIRCIYEALPIPRCLFDAYFFTELKEADVSGAAFDYSRLKGRIKEKYASQEAFAKALGISNALLSNKLNSVADFTQREITKVCELLEIPNEYVCAYFYVLPTVSR